MIFLNKTTFQLIEYEFTNILKAPLVYFFNNYIFKSELNQKTK